MVFEERSNAVARFEREKEGHEKRTPGPKKKGRARFEEKIKAGWFRGALRRKRRRSEHQHVEENLTPQIEHEDPAEEEKRKAARGKKRTPRREERGGRCFPKDKASRKAPIKKKKDVPKR